MKIAEPTVESILPLQSPTARLVLLYLSHSGIPASLPWLCVATGSTPGTIEKTVRQLVRDGYLTRTGNGTSPFFNLSIASK